MDIILGSPLLFVFGAFCRQPRWASRISFVARDVVLLHFSSQIFQ